MRCLLFIFFACSPWAPISLALAEDSTGFQAVAKLFREKCIHCHNDNDFQGELSLQSPESFTKGILDAEQPERSQLLKVLRPMNGTAEMPQDEAPLNMDEIETIRAWIAKGAVWPKDLRLSKIDQSDFNFWSYRPLAEVEVPKMESNWIRNPIDNFVLAQHQRQGLSHSAPATPRELLRRVTYDLTGLPPTAEEVAEFEQNPSPEAYEKVVDRLLESERYGERWARHWLDVVKYADTCGYDKDKLRPNAWPYRDYVIRSFNEDKPYFRFIQEQIAGDVLFPGEPDGILGLGFIAAGPWDFIGHVEVPEAKLDGMVARNLDRDDMVSNALNTFCSLTVQCARCHDHKFDPITQEDYYSLQAIFSGVDRAERRYDTDPSVEQNRRDLESQLAAAKQRLKSIEDEVSAQGGTELKRLRALTQDLESTQKLRKPEQFGYHSTIAAQEETIKWLALEFERPHRINRVVIRPCHDNFNNIGAGFCFPMRFKIEISLDGKQWEVVAEESQGDFANPGLTPYEVTFASQPARWLRLTATKLRERRNDYALAIAEFEAYSQSASENAPESAIPVLRIEAKDSIEAPERWSRENAIDGHYATFEDEQEAEELARAQEQLRQLEKEIETPEIQQRRRRLRESIEATQAKLAKLPAGRMVYAAATHFKPQGNFKPTLGTPRSVHVLRRGNVAEPLEASRPGLLRQSAKQRVEFPLSTAESERRAHLAKWLSDKQNPFVWRSMVNRIWQYHFGDGIVDTPNDFGQMGSRPSHPKLLDWLANRFREGRQSIKELHRLILLSSTYQQSSAHSAQNMNIDASNRYLWRMNRRRLSAEEIRDSILAVSGSLDLRMGGPGFYTFALEKTAHSPHFEYHKFDPQEPDAHRRSIYRFIVRSQPDPWMQTLDCADSSQSTPKRTETLTSLQALALLNNKFNLAMARKMAEELASSHSDSMVASIRQAMQRVVQRNPTPSELQQLTHYAEQHGMANLCRILFNLSEFVFID